MSCNNNNHYNHNNNITTINLHPSNPPLPLPIEGSVRLLDVGDGLCGNANVMSLLVSGRSPETVVTPEGCMGGGRPLNTSIKTHSIRLT